MSISIICSLCYLEVSFENVRQLTAGSFIINMWACGEWRRASVAAVSPAAETSVVSVNGLLSSSSSMGPVSG